MHTKTTYCTISTKNFLAQAKVLAKSLATHNPGAHLVVLLLDNRPIEPEGFEGSVEFIHISELVKYYAELRAMSFYYTPFEFCCAVRPFFFEFLFNRKAVSKLIYLDADIMVFDSCDRITNHFETHNILLTPHLSTASDAGKLENLPLLYGIYNLGVLGLKRSAEVSSLLSWLKGRLKNQCFDALPSGQYVDQLWFNYVPLFFGGVVALKEPGIHLGYWNLDMESRFNIKADGKILFNDHPVTLMHFSKFDYKRPGVLHRWGKHAQWEKIGTRYRDELIVNGIARFGKLPLPYSTFSCGRNVTPKMRSFYFAAIEMGYNVPLDPFTQFRWFKGNMAGSWLRMGFLKYTLFNGSLPTNGFTPPKGKKSEALQRIFASTRQTDFPN